MQANLKGEPRAKDLLSTKKNRNALKLTVLSRASKRVVTYVSVNSVNNEAVTMPECHGKMRREP